MEGTCKVILVFITLALFGIGFLLPTSIRAGTLNILWDDSHDIGDPTSGDEVSGNYCSFAAPESLPYSSELTVDGILQFFEHSVADGSLVGYGIGWPAKIRLARMRMMLEFTAILIETGNIELACWELQRAYARCDEEFPPPDFVEGPATEQLAEMIQKLMESIRCDNAGYLESYVNQVSNNAFLF